MSSFGTLRKDWQPGRLGAEPTAYIGLRVVIFGGTGGVGRAIAQTLLEKGAHVTVVGRSLKEPAHPRQTFIPADLSSLATAGEVARDLPVDGVDAVLLTHGIFAGKCRDVTDEGLERDLATSALSRWVIVNELAPRLDRGHTAGRPKPRMFVWGFPGGERALDFTDVQSARDYSWQTAHGNTVVFNEVLVSHAAARYGEVAMFGLNPGIIKTNIMSGVLGERTWKLRAQRALIGALFQSADAYAGKVLPLLVHPTLEERSGALFNRHAQPIEGNPWLSLEDHRARVVEIARTLTARFVTHDDPGRQLF
ncbi:SDR family NAD(P)-dependent oxidoreductase [Cryobacterium sp. SO1]|uniref:SDR family NAD(P)-dependent oxidoreductase n=1 Tax=Cryobacterium sp. SO1 TaxID=1897061 RepID=UPI00102308F5|nr:SDR family NAD(P)-dependent oxidoreductase [Cryobacterium sp. SO1]RZI37576.1 hypothetical protein BJQ95_00011 [Cryobacterium sp. SO1]